MSKRWMRATDPNIEPHNRDALNLALYSPDNRFFISFLPSIKAANKAFGGDGIRLKDNPTDQETVLVYRGTPGPGNPLSYRYYTLPGDHRKAYEKRLDNGWYACYRYYLKESMS